MMPRMYGMFAVASVQGAIVAVADRLKKKNKTREEPTHTLVGRCKCIIVRKKQNFNGIRATN